MHIDEKIIKESLKKLNIKLVELTSDLSGYVEDLKKGIFYTLTTVNYGKTEERFLAFDDNDDSLLKHEQKMSNSILAFKNKKEAKSFINYSQMNEIIPSFYKVQIEKVSLYEKKLIEELDYWKSSEKKNKKLNKI